ncbi:MAG TPA: transcription antitermination factor NusB [Gemmatimonadaceae bacterium]
MRIETRARARALQALYAWEMRSAGSTTGSPSAAQPGSPGKEAAPHAGLGVDADPRSLVRVADQVWDDMQVPSDQRRIASALVSTVARESGAIDAALADVTTNWRLERLGSIERSVLRLGAAELRRGETPTKVAIQEGVRLAELYGSAQSGRFVNGVLDALARRMGKL